MRERHENPVIPGELEARDSSLLELVEKELIIVSGKMPAKKPKDTIAVKLDGTIVVTQH